ncbi:DoxX family protein [uncultured Psychroserpens sp.]|uniref:DoxX family protein n=1 Tax=uncultured Psychroserpens sp. TaxID=255436 RepID=UPI0026241F72|nr:DoxX family protein [uncultured Psychroserpens sp.]
MKTTKIIYWISTILVALVFLYSAQMYFFKTEMIKGFFEHFNYPTYIVIPLAIAKIAGVVMILWRKSQWLTEWAYAGFFFDLVLATAAHQEAGHGLGLSAMAIPVLIISYFLGKQERPNNLDIPNQE